MMCLGGFTAEQMGCVGAEVTGLVIIGPFGGCLVISLFVT